MMKRIITYGTFDTFHYGHLNILQRARSLGDHLTVGLSSDEFNLQKGKACHFNFETRKHCLESIRDVDQVIAETSWEQKINDIKQLSIDIFVIGDDWAGKFDFLKSHCEVRYLERTPDISSTGIKGLLRR